METKAVETTSNDDDNRKEKAITKEVQRRAKLEANLTAGCGYGRKKQKLLDSFWALVWPRLENAGWRKVDGTATNEGSITFFPPDINETTGKRGKDYYDKIKDVIERVLEKRNEAESKIADVFLDSQEKDEPRNNEKSAQLQRPRRAAAGKSSASDRPSLSGGILDLSWKDGGSTYPKRSSRIGDEFQATNIPAVRVAVPTESQSYCELIWDPKRGESSGAAEFLDSKVPPNKKEQALAPIHSNGYSLTNMTEIISRIDPVDGSDWTDEEKEKFHNEIFRLRKDMDALSRSINKDINACLTYYLGTYKKSDHYRLLKAVCLFERHERAASSVHDIDACAICGDGGNLLICDGCEGEFHMSCLRPPLKSVPEGHWECDECIDRKLVEAREFIIRNCGLYEPIQVSGKKRRVEDPSDDSISETDDDTADDDPVFRPSAAVLKKVKLLAANINKLFSDTQPATTTGLMP